MTAFKSNTSGRGASMRGTSRLQIPRTVIADMLATVARSVKSHTSFLLQQTEVCCMFQSNNTGLLRFDYESKIIIIVVNLF